MNLLGRYQILDQIGTGSMGTVYSARDTVLDREVAIKTIRTSGEVDPEIRERFYREARACARLQHPNIVAVYDLAEADKIAYIAMELLHGSDLRRVIEQRTTVPLASKLAAMVQICEALDHAHRHGVIHRDIKPSNLFLQEDGRAKVMDFGIARLPSSRLTVAGNILGTPNYMAPEQILGKTTDARADLFSAALVFFEFLTLVHPFHATVIPHRIVEGEPDSLFDHDANLPPLLEKVLDRALAKEPDKRYQTGMDFANDLRAVMDAVKLNASPTMSKLELPSERALPKPQPVVEGDMTLLKPAPLGEDPAEWRLSEVLRLIPAFEEAVEAKNRTGAQKALGELKAIGAADKRFTEPAESCQSNYDKTFGQSTGKGTGSGQAPAAPPPLPPPAPPPVSGAAAAAPAPAVKPPPPVPAAGQLKPATTLSGPKISKDQTRMMVAAAVVLAAITAIVWIISLFSHPVQLEMAEGTAKVRAGSAAVRKSPDANGAVIAQVGAGEPLRLLDLPRDRNAAWLRVQPVVNGKNYVPGYVQIADLEDWSEWSVEKPVAMAAVVRAMGPDNNASEDALTAQIVKVKKLADKLVDDQASEQMRQEVTRLEGILAARQQETQQPEVQSAGDAGQPVPPAAGTPAATGPGTPPAVPSTPVVQETPESMLARARRRFDRHELAAAKSLVRQVLRKDPGNKAANELLGDIEDREKLDAETR